MSKNLHVVTMTVWSILTACGDSTGGSMSASGDSTSRATEASDATGAPVTTSDATTSASTTDLDTDASTTTTTTATTTTTTTDATTDATTGPVDDGLCPEQPATDACCCFAEADQFDDYTRNVCPTEPLCGTIKVLCDELALDACPVDQLTTNSDAEIDCALQALIDGGVGRIKWSVSGTINPGQGGHQAVLITVGDGTAFRTGYEFFDLGATVEGVARFELKPKEFFLDCLTRPTAAERFVCLREGRNGQTIESCLAGYITDYF
jgi:hypothetical protein